MSTYEFSYQSPRQRAVLIGLKVTVLGMVLLALYSLSQERGPRDSLNSAGTVFAGFWIYGRLLEVKTEVQELFVPPIDFRHGRELIYIGMVIYIVAMFFGWPPHWYDSLYEF